MSRQASPEEPKTSCIDSLITEKILLRSVALTLQTGMAFALTPCKVEAQAKNQRATSQLHQDLQTGGEARRCSALANVQHPIHLDKLKPPKAKEITNNQTILCNCLRKGGNVIFPMLGASQDEQHGQHSDQLSPRWVPTKVFPIDLIVCHCMPFISLTSLDFVQRSRPPSFKLREAEEPGAENLFTGDSTS